MWALSVANDPVQLFDVLQALFARNWGKNDGHHLLRCPPHGIWNGDVLDVNDVKTFVGLPNELSQSSPTPASRDGFGPHHLVRKSNEAGEEGPSRRGIKAVALVISWGSPQSDNCDKCVRLAQKDAAARVSGMRLAKAFGPVRRQT